ncbi:hypothetical protein pb186bvf_016002 [Paramecium bursaria]
MSQLSSVERTTMIELFSTFFDRLSSNHPQREQMLKSLYQFKALLYTNDSAAERFIQDIGGAGQSKSPLKRDNSQTKKTSSVRKEPQKANKSPFRRQIYSCGHEIDENYNRCITCYPFDDFKIKNQQFFKAIAALDNDEFTKLLQQLDDPMMTSLGKQRCQSSTGELFKDPMNYSRMALEEKQQNQIQQIIRKCLRCNKDIQNDQKTISYFCSLCKNF